MILGLKQLFGVVQASLLHLFKWDSEPTHLNRAEKAHMHGWVAAAACNPQGPWQSPELRPYHSMMPRNAKTSHSGHAKKPTTWIGHPRMRLVYLRCVFDNITDFA